jgi:hypothetical protein
MEFNMARTWITLSASFFDYVFDPVDANQNAPCRRYQPTIGQGGHYGYVTVDGVVVHGSKLNNMLWAIFARWWGWPEATILGGANLNQLARDRRLDGITSQNAIHLGFDIYDLLIADPSASIDLSAVMTESRLRTLVDATSLIEERLWPSPDPADISNSTFLRPILPTMP